MTKKPLSNSRFSKPLLCKKIAAKAGKQKDESIEIAARAGKQKDESTEIAARAGKQKDESAEIAAKAGKQKDRNKIRGALLFGARVTSPMWIFADNTRRCYLRPPKRRITRKKNTAPCRGRSCG